jgi:sugar lactone lactonase YvrE
LVFDGLGIPESPRWHDGRLWLCNWTTGQVLTVAADGSTEIAAQVPTTIPYSIDWLPDGRMLIVSGQESLLLRRESDGSLVQHADLTALGDVFNESVVDAHGDGTAREVARDLEFGNGMALTDDGRTLIVAESHGGRLTAFDVEDNGSLANRRVWADLAGDSPDGICLDASGAVWYASVPGQHCVRVRDGGEVLQVVEADRGCFACMLGGDDGRTLYVTAARWHGMEHLFDRPADGQLLAERVDVPHAGRP